VGLKHNRDNSATNKIVAGEEWTDAARVIFIITENQTYSIAENLQSYFTAIDNIILHYSSLMEVILRHASKGTY
jgi:hypothetical protein